MRLPDPDTLHYSLSLPSLAQLSLCRLAWVAGAIAVSAFHRRVVVLQRNCHLDCCRLTIFWLRGGYDGVWESNSVEPEDVVHYHLLHADDRVSCEHRLNDSNETVQIIVALDGGPGSVNARWPGCF